MDFTEDQEIMIEQAKQKYINNPFEGLMHIVEQLKLADIYAEFEMVVSIPAFKPEREQESDQIQVIIPIIECEIKDSFSYYVNWGDGTITLRTKEHVYTQTDQKTDYTIKFFGLGICGFGHMYNSFSQHHLTKIISFGNLGKTFTRLEYAFSNCANLISVPPILPSSITNLRGLFYGCVNFNQPLNTWITSNVVNMDELFAWCETFNQPLNMWDVSNVVNMYAMFEGCTKFNQPLDQWDVSNVTDMASMFCGCNAFNQPLNKWNTTNVEEAYGMFCSCKNFNQPLDAWNVNNITEMSYMFSECENFNQSLETWNVGCNTNTEFMFLGCGMYKHNKPNN